MGATKKVQSHDSMSSLRPASSMEDRENQLIAMAMNLAEERLRNKTASAQEVVHFLKLGATKEKDKLERKKLEKETELLSAKTEMIDQQKDNNKLYAEAIDAFKRYSGVTDVQQMLQ